MSHEHCVRNIDDDDSDDFDCPDCGGEGFTEGDCFEDTCCCLNPEESHGVIPCSTCRQKWAKQEEIEEQSGGTAERTRQ